jgi:Gas vesicle protein K
MGPGRRTPSLSDDLEALRHELQHVRGTLPDRIDVDPEGVEQGLAQLVLTLVEFLRQVLERQAVRRMEGGSLSDEEVERVGLALMKLEDKVHELAEQFGLRPSDLNINLGPLGDLL